MVIALSRLKKATNVFMIENQPTENSSLIPKINVTFIYYHVYYYYFSLSSGYLFDGKKLGLV